MFPQKEPNLCQRRWLELLKDYDMSMIYHQGKANILADDLSMFFMGSVAQLRMRKRSWLERCTDLDGWVSASFIQMMVV